VSHADAGCLLASKERGTQFISDGKRLYNRAKKCSAAAVVVRLATLSRSPEGDNELTNRSGSSLLITSAANCCQHDGYSREDYPHLV